MACKGIRPDGNQCTCADEFTDPKTGLCASCAAPESTALVPVGSTDLMADPEVGALYEALPPKAKQFIRAYVETFTIDKGAQAAGIHRNSHYYWKKHTHGYLEVFEVADREVNDRLDSYLVDKTMDGLREVMYDADGNLRHTRIREDAGLIKMLLASKNPETYNPEKSTGGNVTIVLKHVQEGWTDEDERDWSSTQTANAKELDSIPEADVIATDTVEETGVSNEAPVEERRGGSGETFRQRQRRAGWLSKLPDDLD